jgi:hypothetical protein
MLLGFLELLIVALFLWRLQVAASRSRLPHGGEAGIASLAAIASAVGSAAGAAGTAIAGAATGAASAAAGAGSAALGALSSAAGTVGSALGLGGSGAAGAGGAAGTAGAGAAESAIGATGAAGTSELVGTAGAPITPGAVTSGAAQSSGLGGLVKSALSGAEGKLEEHPLVKAFLKAETGIGEPTTKEDFLAQAFKQLTTPRQQQEQPQRPVVQPLQPLSGTGFEIPRMQEGGFIQPLGGGVRIPQGVQLDAKSSGNLGQPGFLENVIQGLGSMFARPADLSSPRPQITDLPRLQEGGQIAQGQAVVGEKGPELVTVTPAGAQVTPLPQSTQEAVSKAAANQTQTPSPSQPAASPSAQPQEETPSAPTPAGFQAAQPPPEKTGGFSSRLADFLIFAGAAQQGLPGIANYLQQRRMLSLRMDQNLAAKAISNPDLLRVSGEAVKAVDSILGPGTAQSLLDQRNPDIQARHIARIFGVDLQPGNEFDQLRNQLAQRGLGLQYTTDGKMRITQAGRTASEQDAITASNAFQQVKQAILAQNPKMDEATADQLAAKRTVQIGAARGFTIPKPIQDFADATTQTQIETSRAAAKAFVEQAAQLKFASAIAQQREAGRRAARLNTPISTDEIQVANAEAARALGGVSIGREPKDEDLINADQQNQVLKQLPDGSFVAIPRDRLPQNDSSFLAPSTLLAQRIQQRIATRTTNQQQNAKIVLSKLDEIDSLHALDLLVPASQQGPTLPEKVAGALSTEARGQALGRVNLFTGIRSPDPAESAKALSLYNLQFIVNSVVKATGDTGHISETDRQNFQGRLERIFTGVASREEATTTLMQMRQLMMAAAAGALNKEVASQILNNPNPQPQAPPPGFTPVPGTGAHYQIVP